MCWYIQNVAHSNFVQKPVHDIYRHITVKFYRSFSFIHLSNEKDTNLGFRSQLDFRHAFLHFSVPSIAKSTFIFCSYMNIYVFVYGYESRVHIVQMSTVSTVFVNSCGKEISLECFKCIASFTMTFDVISAFYFKWKQELMPFLCHAFAATKKNTI